VLRVLLELDGETVLNAIPDIGYLHTGIEKNMEAKTYLKAEVMTDRLDYMNTTGNNLAYCLAVEKLVDLDVPPRAQAIRVILTELQRIASHLVWLGAFGLDLAAMSVFLYCFREREMILDILELCSGQRMMTTFIRPGGIWRDVPVEFESAVRNFLKIFPKRVDEYEALMTKNPLFMDRLYGIGKLDGATALQHGVTGPTLRASGVNWDLRKARPYCGYEQYDFNIPTRTEGDTFARQQPLGRVAIGAETGGIDLDGRHCLVRVRLSLYGSAHRRNNPGENQHVDGLGAGPQQGTCASVGGGA